MVPKSRFRHGSLNLGCFLVGPFLLLLAVSHCSAKAWQGIVVLHSATRDVHDLCRNPFRLGKYTSPYESPDLSIAYLPAAVDGYLSCSETLYSRAQSPPIFEQYGMISPSLEKAILDNFAIQLLSDENLTGYVVLRRGRYSSKLAAKKLLFIRNHLFKQRRVPVSRVSVFEGKRQRDFTVELYLVPKGTPGPT